MTPSHTSHTTQFPESADLPPALTRWMPHQRWFAGKGQDVDLLVEGYLELAGGARDYLVRDLASPNQVLYQVPLSAYRVESDEERALSDALPEASLVGEVGGLRIHDGAQDPRVARALLAAVLEERTLEGGSRRGRRHSTVDPTEGHGHRSRGEGAMRSIDSVDAVLDAKLLGGEQSNSSIVYRTQGEGPDIIGKVFRMIHAGVNPDVEIQEALASAGCRLVPAPLGDITGTWEDDESEDVQGHLFFAQEFIPGASDAWRVATDAAAHGASFSDRAHALGAATAEVHATLAQELPSWPADDATVDEFVGRWLERMDSAIAAVPELGRHEEAFRSVYAAALEDEWPELQRIHGDYHLGQVLDVPGRGWVLLDFEGEPLRPLEERTVPDLATRDIAGMLRSFDYAAGSVALEDPDHATTAARWAAEARSAFLGGYAEQMPPVSDPRHHRALLAALEIDKALYEVVYEARNRPAWIDIPLGGIRRILRGS